MKIDRSRVRKSTSEIPAECQQLIESIQQCSRTELLHELSKINSWTFGKCELLHWAQVLDIFDKILGAAAERSEDNKWALKCDSFSGKDKLLLICILRFTSLLIEHSFSRHLYNSMEHLLVLLTSNEMNVVLEVLNLLYMFSKRSNFITRLKTEEKECLLARLQYLAENWGGKENGFGLADCCNEDKEIPSSATTLHVEFHLEDSAKSPNKDNTEVNPKSGKPTLHIIHIEHIDKLNKTPAEIMKSLKGMYYIPAEKEMWLFTHVRLATNFANFEKRLKCVQARLQALSVLVYANAIQDSTSNLLYNGILEELVEVVELNEPELTDIRCAALRTLTAIIHLDRNPQFPKRPGARLNSIIDVTGASQYHGFLPVLVRNCIVSLTNHQKRTSKKRKHQEDIIVIDSSEEMTDTSPDEESNIEVNAIQALSAHPEFKFPVSLTTALFSFLYHLASYDVGGEALVSCGMMESLLEVINWQGYELDHITFVTRAVRVIDLITNIDMQAFQVHGGLTSFINRLDVEVNFCNDDQLYQFTAHNLDDNIPMNEDNTPIVELEYAEDNIGKSCLPQRAALLKSLLNFLKKAFQDSTFAESIRHLMESPLPSALKNIIANAEYYGPSLFLLATDVVTVYVYQEPTVLPALQDNGLTNIVLHSLLMKEVPATREVLGSLPNVFSALCLNARGLELFARHRPFDKLFHILLSPLYLPAMRRRRSSEPAADTASNLGNAMDELMRHQPSLRQDATIAIVSLLEELVYMGSDPKYICWRPHGRAEPLSTTPGRAAPTEGSSDEEEEDEDETSTSSNAQTQNETNATQSAAGNERQLIPLIDYILNAMKFIDAILSNNSTDDHCREFVQKGGLKPLLRLLGLPNLPADCPVTNPAQSVATVCKSILNLAHEPFLFQEGLHQLSEVLDHLKPLCAPTDDTKSTMGGSRLLMELASAPDASAAFSSAQATPLLHAMGAAHGYVLMFVHVCRTGQPEIRNLSLHHWGKKEGSKVLKGLADLYTALVWESTLLLAYCSDDLIPSECDFTRESIEKLNQFFDRCETTQHVSEVPSNHSSGIDVGVVPMDIDGTEYPKSDSRNLKYIKPLLGASSRLGRALAELFGLLVKLCVGSPVRQRRGQNIITAPPAPSIHAKKVALALNLLLAKGLDCESLPPCPTPKCRLTFLICSVGFTSPMLFDERRYPYYLMLKKFVSMGGQATFFKTFNWALGSDEGPSDVNALPEGTLGFLDAWLTLLEKMVNPKAILESPHVVSTRPNATYNFDPIKYLIQIHRLAFDSIEKLWKYTPITSYGNRIAETILTILRHIYWGEKIIKEKLKQEDTRTTTATEQPSTSNNGFVAIRDSEANLRQLEDMGFSRENAIDALLHSSSVEQATDYLLSNPPQAARASTSAVDPETTEDDQVLQAIAMSLGGNSNFENPHAIVEELQALLDEFTKSALDMCLDLLNKMPDLVHKTCELLVTIMKRNGKEYRDTVLQSIARHILQNAMDIYSATVNKFPSKTTLDAMVDTLACKRLANYTHLFILFYEVGSYYEMKLPYLALYGSETINLIIRLIKKAQHIIVRVFKNTRDIPEPKWLASSLLLVDAYLKVANRTDRKCKMHISTNRVWRWYDLVTGRWTHYSAANNLAINEAYWSGEQSVKVTCGRKRYTITFPTMLQMNDETGNNRPIAMTLLSFTHPSCNDIKEKVPKDALFAELTKKEDLRCTPVPSMPRFEKRLILKSCVNMLHMPLERDLLHSILQICVRFTREFKMAKEFVREGGIKCLLSIRHIADFGGFGVLATILIRHALEEPNTLTYAMEKVIRGRTLTAIPPPYRDLVYLTRQLGAAVTRDPHVFFKVARNILRVDISACKPGDSLDVVLPIKSEPPVLPKAPPFEEPVSIQVVCDLLDALLVPLFEKSRVGTKINKKESKKPDNLNAGNNPLAANIGGPSTSNATTSNTDKNKDSPKTNEEESESKPMLPKSVVLKILADAVISYGPIAKLITEHTYKAKCCRIISEDTSALAFIFDKILPETENISDSDCSSMCRMLIAALASANHSPEAQLSLVNEVKAALNRALTLAESSEKHSQIQHICGIISTMIDNCPVPPRGIPNVAPVNNIIKIMIRRGLFSDLAKISHFLDLSSPHRSFTLNAALKPLESLSRSINMPSPNTTTVRGRRPTSGTLEDVRTAAANPQHVRLEEDLENAEDGQSEATTERNEGEGERDRLEEIMEQILEGATERAVPMEGGPLSFNAEADPTEEMMSTDSGESDSNPSDDNDEDGNNDEDNGADANIEDNDDNDDGDRDNGERRNRAPELLEETPGLFRLGTNERDEDVLMIHYDGENETPWPRLIRWNENRFSVPMLDENSGDHVIIHPLLLSRNTGDSNQNTVTRNQRTTRPRRYQYLFDPRNPNPPVILQRLLGTHDPHAMANMMTANNILTGPADGTTREQARVVIMDNFGIIPSNEEQIDFVDQSGYMFGPSLAATLNYVPPVVHWWNMESKILDLESVFDCTAWICNRLLPILIKHRNKELRLKQAEEEKTKKQKAKPVAESEESGQSGQFVVFNFDEQEADQNSQERSATPLAVPDGTETPDPGDASDSSDSVVVIGVTPQLMHNYPFNPNFVGNSATRGREEENVQRPSETADTDVPQRPEQLERNVAGPIRIRPQRYVHEYLRERANDNPQRPRVPFAPIAQRTDDLDRNRTDIVRRGNRRLRLWERREEVQLSDASRNDSPFLHDDLDLELESMEVRRLSRTQQSARFTGAWAAQAANLLGNQPASPDSEEIQSQSATEQENSSRETENLPTEENTPTEQEQSPRGEEVSMGRENVQLTMTMEDLESLYSNVSDINAAALAREGTGERSGTGRSIGIVPDCIPDYRPAFENIITTQSSRLDTVSTFDPVNVACTTAARSTADLYREMSFTNSSPDLYANVDCTNTAGSTLEYSSTRTPAVMSPTNSSPDLYANLDCTNTAGRTLEFVSTRTGAVMSFTNSSPEIDANGDYIDPGCTLQYVSTRTPAVMPTTSSSPEYTRSTPAQPDWTTSDYGPSFANTLFSPTSPGNPADRNGSVFEPRFVECISSPASPSYVCTTNRRSTPHYGPCNEDCTATARSPTPQFGTSEGSLLMDGTVATRTVPTAPVPYGPNSPSYSPCNTGSSTPQYGPSSPNHGSSNAVCATAAGNTSHSGPPSPRYWPDPENPSYSPTSHSSYPYGPDPENPSYSPTPHYSTRKSTPDDRPPSPYGPDNPSYSPTPHYSTTKSTPNDRPDLDELSEPTQSELTPSVITIADSEPNSPNDRSSNAIIATDLRIPLSPYGPDNPSYSPTSPCYNTTESTPDDGPDLDDLSEPTQSEPTPSVITITDSDSCQSSQNLFEESVQNNAAEQGNAAVQDNAVVQDNTAAQTQSNSEEVIVISDDDGDRARSENNDNDAGSETSASSPPFESPYGQTPAFIEYMAFMANRGLERAQDGGSSSSSSSDIPSQEETRRGIPIREENRTVVEASAPILIEDDDDATGEDVRNSESTATVSAPGPSNAPDEEEIPDGVDPSFLEALPPEIRREVLEQQRILSLHQRLATRVTEEVATNAPAETGESSSSSEAPQVVSPEFLAALPPALQEEVLSQQRFDQQRQAAARAPPNEPVDAHAFFQTLQPSLRTMILADMEDSQISALPPELAAEAQNLRRDWYARNRQIAQERFLQSNLPTIIRQNRGGRAGHRPISFQRGGWSQWSREFMASTTIRSPSTQMRIRGRQLLDHEGISCLLILLFTDDSHLNKLRLHRVIRNLCYHAPTREWIINALLSIIDKSVNTKPDESLNKPVRKGPRVGPLTSKLQTDSRHLNTGGHWLTIRMEAALGCAANVFLINKTGGKKAVGGHQAICLHPQAAPVVCRNTLDLFTALAKAFPACLLPIKLFREDAIERNAVSPVKLNAPGQPDFWDILLKLDSIGGKKGKSIAKSTNFYSNSGENDNLSFENSVFGRLLNMLGSPVVNRNTQLTDNLLKLLSVTTSGMPELVKPHRPKTSKIETADMSSASINALSLAVNVITYKNCSEEGLEFITTLLLNLASSSQDMSHMILNLLLKGAAEIGMIVEKQIQFMLEDLKRLIRRSPKKKDDKEGPSTSKGVIYNRFTNEQVIIMASAKVKTACELQLPSMVPLTSKSSSQIFFLRVLRVIVQIRNSIKNNIKRNNLEVELVALSEQLGSLESLWETLSSCLFQLEHAPDHHAVLVLQPAVEAFFLVHSPQQGAISYKDNEKETAIVSEVVVVDVQQQSEGDAPVTGEAAASAQNNVAAAQSIVTELAGAVLSGAGTSSQDDRSNTSSSQDDGTFSSTSTIPHDYEHRSTPIEQRQVSSEQQKFLAFAEKHRTVLNQILRQSTAHLADGPFAVLVDHTRILDFDIKRRYFRTELERMDHGIRREETAVHVRRNNVFEDSFRELFRRTPEEWKNRFYIVFEEEEGQDAGGLLREWYVIISRDIFNPMYALFTVSPGDRVTYMINSASHYNSNHLCYYKFVGRVIAKAIYDNKLLECYFTRSFYKHILGIPVKYTDMESEDYTFYRGLIYLMENNIKNLGLDLMFSTEISEFGVTETRDLIPNGRHIPVLEENKMEYVRLVCQMKMTGEIKQQLTAFLEGFYDIIPMRLISIFNEQELELLISGLPNVDIDDLKANTEYHKYQSNSLQIQWFWRALRSFDQADRAKFLQFVTGTSKVPLQGFGALEGMNGVQKFQIHRDDRSTDRLPSAHTCFNQLDLPVYETFDKLKAYLLKAIHECSEGFGFA